MNTTNWNHASRSTIRRELAEANQAMSELAQLSLFGSQKVEGGAFFFVSRFSGSLSHQPEKPLQIYIAVPTPKMVGFSESRWRNSLSGITRTETSGQRNSDTQNEPHRARRAGRNMSRGIKNFQPGRLIQALAARALSQVQLAAHLMGLGLIVIKRRIFFHFAQSLIELKQYA
ncbi:hypothetical protein [Pseudomonas helleri]|uniref:hypothetical protein n=1 Tax=Pseudomonas helleri TaxID=1608996 RepID=UPI0021C79C6D|nr:hypothetical protein [Pseudomonas helleri]MCU1754697.1 hypothetical protein [Pseudomonas helleri]